MECLYSLYDSLVSIDVPNDKARAVVDAMERDMATTIATKADLQLLQQATRGDLQLLQQEMKADLNLLRQEMKADRQLLRQEITAEMAGIATSAEVAELRKDNAIIHKEIDHLLTTMTVRLGSLLVIGLGLFAALKLA